MSIWFGKLVISSRIIVELLSPDEYMRKEKGERRKEKGERRKEKGERRKEKGERRKEKA